MMEIKPLDISKEQVNMLLEMCKALFSEYYYIEFCDGNIMFIHKDNQYKEYPEDYMIEIHWFELCLNQLGNKITKLIGYKNIKDYISMNDYFILVSPIEYLYEKFKIIIKTNE